MKFIKIIKFKFYFHYTFKYPSINNGVCNFFTPKLSHSSYFSLSQRLYNFNKISFIAIAHFFSLSDITY